MGEAEDNLNLAGVHAGRGKGKAVEAPKNSLGVSLYTRSELTCCVNRS